MRAYLDIETTFNNTISVIGIYRSDRGTIQLVGNGVHDCALYDALEGVSTLVTFNGTCFDLPTIRRCMGLELKHHYEHCDLMYVCRRANLRGGLKKIEAILGIGRETAGISGMDAPRLWARYERYGDREALKTLLRYNQEDVINLPVLEAHVGVTTLVAPCESVFHIFA